MAPKTTGLRVASAQVGSMETQLDREEPMVTTECTRVHLAEEDRVQVVRQDDQQVDLELAPSMEESDQASEQDSQMRP